MRRIGDIWPDIIADANLMEASGLACRSRRDKKEVARFKEKETILLRKLKSSLVDHTYHSSKYRIFQVNENGKIRDIADLPLYPDRIFHWAIALGLEEKLNRKLIDQTHASRPGHGIHSAVNDIRNYIRKDGRIKYALKTDVSKFFPSVDKNILKSKLRGAIKDKDLIFELDKLIDDYPYPGLPIGNRTSPMFANLYLSEMDHTMKEIHHCHYYVRYMDDIVVLGYSKQWLHQIRKVMSSYLNEIGLKMKENWQVFPIDSRGIDFVGYRIFTDHILLRKRIKNNLKKATGRILSNIESDRRLTEHDRGTIASYNGILLFCNGYNLRCSTLSKIEQKMKDLEPKDSFFSAISNGSKELTE
ncbi:MAG: RNA-directed DNA polymerase [Candidatus Methanomethylophilaceae archaeon]|nr:RNA-directed DNA polymerase [Candidatus Methanomethylophilaceae archaeon]